MITYSFRYYTCQLTIILNLLTNSFAIIKVRQQLHLKQHKQRQIVIIHMIYLVVPIHKID